MTSAPATAPVLHRILSAGPLAWERSGLAAARIARLLAAELARQPRPAAPTTVRRLLGGSDHRLAAHYLHALRAGDETSAGLLERAGPGTAGALRYRAALAAFRHVAAAPVPVREAGSAAEVLTGDGPATALWIADPGYRAALTRLLADLGGRVGAFAECQLDVGGPNARIRQGVVRSWHLPDGRRVASKRENPQKPDRFRREIDAYRRVCERLRAAPGTPVPVGGAPAAPAALAGVVPVVALVRDGPSGALYALSEWRSGPTLEDLLLTGPGGAARASRLGHYRLILDLLFDRGVSWGDMSPRNIVVDDSGPVPIYWLLDFEKTRVAAAPLPDARRHAFCRGQAAVEELGVLCTPDEVAACLHGWFDPAGWDVDAPGPVPFEIRPEVAAVLDGRGRPAPTLGEYNRVDLEFVAVRSPAVDGRTGELRHPGRLGFQVEHYLSCAFAPDADDFDRMTTEALIAGRRHGCFDEVVDALAAATQRVEAAFVVAEFRLLLATGGRGQIRAPAREIARLRGLIRRLYAARHDGRALRRACGHLPAAKHDSAGSRAS